MQDADSKHDNHAPSAIQGQSLQPGKIYFTAARGIELAFLNAIHV
jgi:hypothetical protein